MERKDAKGPAVNLSTSLPPFARGFVGPEGPLVRTFAKLSAESSRRTPPSYRHHPQFAFLKGAQKPPEIAAGSSDVTADSISALSLPSTDSPPPLFHSFFLFFPFYSVNIYVCVFLFSSFICLSLSSTIDNFTSRYLPRRQEFR